MHITCDYKLTNIIIEAYILYMVLRVFNHIYDNECLIYINMPTFFVQAEIANILKYIAYFIVIIDTEQVMINRDTYNIA